MRLIDADALIEEIVKIQDLRTLSTKTIGEAISRTPTIERKKGKWIKLGDHPNEGWMNVRCSECGKTMAYYIHTEIRPNYCPNCGARMEAKDE